MIKMKILNYYTDLFLIENKKVAKQIIPSIITLIKSKDKEKDFKELFDEITKIDPSNNKKYMGRIAKWVKYYIENNINNINLGSFLDDVEEHIYSFNYFDSLPNKPEKFKPLANIDSKEWSDYFFWKSNLIKFENEYNKNKINKVAGNKGQKILYEDDKVTVYKILSKQGMALCAKDTPWCVSMPAGKNYENYTKNGKFYFLVLRNKQIELTKEMVEASSGKKGDVLPEYFIPSKEGYCMIALLIDSKYNFYANKSSFTDFGNNTTNIEKIDFAKYNNAVGYDLNNLTKKLNINRYDKLEDPVEFIKKYQNKFKGLIDSGQIDLENNEELQLAAVEKEDTLYQDTIDNINHILDKDIIPSEKVQLAAVDTGTRIKNFLLKGIIPSYNVQLKAVYKNGLNIYDILYWGVQPKDEEKLNKLLLLSVNGDFRGKNIKYILDADIIPSEEVQLAAVKDSGDMIMSLIKKGIEPSEEVQLAAIHYKAYLFPHIPNKTDLVNYFYKRKWDKKPADNEKLEQIYLNYINTGKLINEHYKRIKKLMF